MKNKQITATHKTGHQVVEEKLRMTNSYLKSIDMNKLNETIRQAKNKEITS